MHILLIAYEFPPSPSPQSLRWAYLSRHLSEMGHRVSVLTIQLSACAVGLPHVPNSVAVYRTFAGPMRGALAVLRHPRLRPAKRNTTSASPDGMTRPNRNNSSRQGWQQALSDSLQSVAARVLFPDVRGEWRPWASRKLRSLLDKDKPDIVIASHEPATSLELGLLAAKRNIPWVADLGDPVLAHYTPRRWQNRALRLEREVCRNADHVTVTTATAAELLSDRHGRFDHISVVPQGYETDTSLEPPCVTFDPTKLELLYTGSFYWFRRPDALLEALRTCPDARLNIAAITLPDSVIEAARDMPERVRLLGFLPHRQAVAMQRGADVLVNIGNANPSQVPGKIYEYLGSQRPILHLGDPDDAISALQERLQRGWNRANETAEVSAWMREAVEAKRQGILVRGLDLGLESVDAWNWKQIAAQVDTILRSVVR